jgi:uncharacterized protein (DUF885 family)
MARARQIADDYLAEAARLDPVSATFRGISGHDAEMTDYSPDGIAARTDLARRTLDELSDAEVADDDERRGADLLGYQLALDLEVDAAGESLRPVRIMSSPVQAPRQVFDLMARDTADDWEVIAARLTQVPAALAGATATLRAGMDGGLVAARRQALACAEQAATWAGLREVAPFFQTMVAGASGCADAALTARLDAGAQAATKAYGALAEFLAGPYATAASEIDAVGAERYRLFARKFLGADIDLVGTYAWGWDELYRIEKEMAATADRIVPGATVAEAEALLESDPARAIEGEENLRAWLQDLMDRTVAELDGRHFDIPEPIKRVEAMIAPPGGAAAMYYTPPSLDFSRPGRTWYPTLGRTRFPLWGEVSIAYHEGVPGHHLQLGQVCYEADRLSTFQRTSFVSGHGEGWALYAERLMDELGYLENPDYRLGQLRAQALRAVRVIVDLGMHLELAIPERDAFHPGETWTPDLGREFVTARSHFPADFMASEIIRYLGMPAQAISYKVGERVWLDARDEVRRRAGPAFDIKAFHASALQLGPLGLDQLQAELRAL